MTNIEDAVRKQLVAFIVQRQIFCPITNAVLDVRTCKWLVDKNGDPAYVMSPEAYDAVASGLNTEKGKVIIENLAARGLYLKE